MILSKLTTNLCTKCWGSLKWRGETCSRCKGTGDEPDNFIGWWAIGAIVVILIVFLFAEWSIPK